jgi:hypothetical protein
MPLQCLVFGLVDDTHAAAADLPQNPILAELFRNRRRRSQDSLARRSIVAHSSASDCPRPPLLADAKHP